MKLGGITIKGRTRSVLLVMAGLGTAAAMTLAPLAAWVGQAGATTPTPVTTTTTVVTNGTWTSPQGKTTTVLIECANKTSGGYTYVTITGATWIWANLGQPACSGTGAGASPPDSTVTLSTTFTIPGTPQGATLALAVDNGATVSINGQVVATLSSTNTPITNFTAMHQFTISTPVFVTGANTISILGHNGGPTGYNPAGVVAKLTVSSTSTPTNLCKHTGWKDWTTTPGPFKNQGDCVSYFVKNPNGADPTIPNTAQS